MKIYTYEYLFMNIDNYLIMKFSDEYTKKYNDNLDKDIACILEKYKKEPYYNDTWYSKYNFISKREIDWIPLRACCSCDDMIDKIKYLEEKHPNLHFKCDSQTRFTASLIGYRTLYVGIKRLPK